MKKLFIFLFTIVLFFSCNNDDDEIIFDADPSDVQITFEPFEGGAFMNYTFPNNSEIYAIQAKYKDFNNKEITLKGTCYNTKLEIIGFTEVKTQEPIEISLLDKDNHVSKTITKYFNTLTHGSISVFDNINITTNWNGFDINYSAEKSSDGFIHVGYIGVNPETNKMGTILIKSSPINEGETSISYCKILDPDINKVDIVVWTEDFRGNDVEKKIYKDIPIARAEIFECKDVDFIGSSDENEKYHNSWKYLFDGDKRGIEALKNTEYWGYCFRSEKHCVEEGADPEKSIWTVDLKEAQKLAYLKMYAHAPIFFPASKYDPTLTSLRRDSKFTEPCHVKVYGTNDINTPLEQCDLLGEFKQSPTVGNSEKWSFYSFTEYLKLTLEDIDKVEKYPEIYAQVNFKPSEKQYRYIKIKVLEVFYDLLPSGNKRGGNGDIYMEELEVFVKKN